MGIHPPPFNFDGAKKSPRARQPVEGIEDSGPPTPEYRYRVLHLSPPAIRHGRLPGMARSAQHLPVQLIPEELLIAFMRNDVIHNLRRFQDSFTLTLDAERMPLQECFSRDAPFPAITAGCRGTSLFVILSLFLDPVSFASAVTGIDERSAARITTRMFRRVWRMKLPHL
jgi:hypothetical protein